MAVERIVNIKVKETGLDEINKDLVSLDKNLDNVSGTGEKASESIDEVTKNGGAIAVLDQLTGGLATRMRDAWEATKLFNTSLKGVRAALIATGIGAIVVALGVIVAYWDEITDIIKGTSAALERHLELLNEQQEIIDARIKLNDSEIELAKLQGKEVDKLIAKQKELNKQKLATLITELEILEAQKIEAEEQSKGFSIIKALTTNRIFGQGKTKKERKEILDLDKKILEIRELINKAEIGELKAQATGEGVGDTSITSRVEVSSVSEVDSSGVVDASQDPKVLLQSAVNDELKTMADDLADYQQKKREQEAIEDQILAQQKIDLTLDTLGKIMFVLGENSAAGKAAGIAQALINTYLGVTEVLANKTVLPEPFGTINKIASIATVLKMGFDSVKAITATKLPANSKGGSASGGGGGVSAPSFNVVGTSGTNQLAQAIQQDDQPIRAYVVGSEISSQQALDRNIQDTATIVG